MAQGLDTEVQFLKGVGPRFAPGLAKLGLQTVQDVLWAIPRRYEDRRNIPPIAFARPGDWVTIIGTVSHMESRPLRGGMLLLKAYVRDSSGMIALTWFNQPWIQRTLEKYEGQVVAYGQVKDGNRYPEMASPEWETLGEGDDPEDFAKIVPVYPLKEGVTQKTMRKAARSAVRDFIDFVEDPLPQSLREREKIRGLRWCLKQIHEPDTEVDRLEARRRLVFEEFFYLQVGLAMRRAEVMESLGIAFPVDDLLAGRTIFDALPAVPTPPELGTKKRRASVVKPDLAPTHLFEEGERSRRDGEPLLAQVERMLPFTLTGAQQRVVHEIWDDMKAPHPMNRLLQGDVGSGKTAVAACAMLAAVRSGYQAALMAPTEILAEQHAVNLRQLFSKLDIEVELMVGKLTMVQKRRALERVRLGQAWIAVGTHALIQEGVEFRRLGLAVIDEQHRFGVLQRAALREKGMGQPDVLVMTATPIPRTLTMTVYGDLSSSIIDELPPGRKPIKTHWKSAAERKPVYASVRKLVEEGRQAYFVCPMVSESEKMLAQAAEDLYQHLSEEAFSGIPVGLLHGQMKSAEKELVMNQFRTGDLRILVATTVIEVGVDVPNASVMVIEDANRFGLAQLHQLRGRVGRGDQQSFCILIADVKSDEARTRMEVMVRTTDGFEISEEDLKLRGPGMITGTQQSGAADFRIADLLQDSRLLEVARQAAIRLIADDPSLSQPEHQGILEKVGEKRGQMAMVSIS